MNTVNIRGGNKGSRKNSDTVYHNTARDLQDREDWRHELASLIRWQASNFLRAGDKAMFSLLGASELTVSGPLT